MIRFVLKCLLVLMLLSNSVWAVEADEVLKDPVLEQRARSISAGLRCLQCRNESIDESAADIARDLRLLVRERLVEGDSDTEVVDYIVARYGEYVLLRPNGTGMNLVLWLSGPALLLLTLLGLWAVRKTQKPEGFSELSYEEEQKLAALLAEDTGED